MIQTLGLTSTYPDSVSVFLNEISFSAILDFNKCFGIKCITTFMYVLLCAPFKFRRMKSLVLASVYCYGHMVCTYYFSLCVHYTVVLIST